MYSPETNFVIVQRPRRLIPRWFSIGLSAAVLLVVIPGLSSAETIAPGVCASGNAFVLTDSLSGSTSPCAVDPHKVIVETVYLQNASLVGGTALAAYPLVHVRAGIVPRLQLTVDLPSTIAQSLPGGRGAYPSTHLGYGASYMISQTGRSATSITAEVLPPDSHWAPTHVQSRYVFGVASDFVVTRRLTLGINATGTSSAREGFGLILPSVVVSSAYDVGARTQVVAGLGTRTVTHRSVSQSFGDIGVNQVLSKNWIFNVGLGSTFNAVNETKPHYLASGFIYHP